MNDFNTKRCSRCKTAKEASAWHSSQWRNGSWCKVCYRKDYASRSSKVRWQRIIRDYGISQIDYQAMLEAQGGVCSICKKPERTKRFKFLAVDHDHLTGKVRGLLCHRCNAGLGNFNDAVNLLRAAADYLEKHLSEDLKIFRTDVRAAFPEFAVESQLFSKRQSSKITPGGVF